MISGSLSYKLIDIDKLSPRVDVLQIKNQSKDRCYLAESAPRFCIRGAKYSPSTHCDFDPFSISFSCLAFGFKMTRFGFLSLALLSLQAFVGTGFAAVCFNSCSASKIPHRMTQLTNWLQSIGC